MQKGNILIYLLIGILVLGGVAGGAYYLGRQTTPKPSPNPVVTSQTPQPTKFIDDKSAVCIKEEQAKDYTKGAIIVGYEGILLDEAEKIINAYGLSIEKSLDSIKTLWVKVPVGSEVEWACKFRTDNRFKSAGVTQIYSIPDCKQGPC